MERYFKKVDKNERPEAAGSVETPSAKEKMAKARQAKRLCIERMPLKPKSGIEKAPHIAYSGMEPGCSKETLNTQDEGRVAQSTVTLSGAESDDDNESSASKLIQRKQNPEIQEITQGDASSSSDMESEKESTATKTKRLYKQKIRNAWLKYKRFCKWIAEDKGQVFCRCCGCKLRPRLFGLIHHSKTSKHIAAAATMSQQLTIPFKPAQTAIQIKKAELSNALFIASHTSIRSVDHLSKLQKKSFSDSEVAAELKLGRTKCSALIKRVLSPYFKDHLLLDIGNNKFSLLIDESTDIGVNKYLGIVIRYFSKKSKSIINTFLKLADIETLTAQGIVASITQTFEEFGLDIKNLTGLGTDNASVMVGVNKGVISLLQRENPHVTLVPCICHSIQLAVSSASKSIPNEIEFLVAETYNWFSKSSSRQKSYKKIYAAINDGHDPLKIVRACETRWMSIETAVTKILNQWLELKTQFGIAAVAEYCHKANLLVGLYNNTNLAYLHFLAPILQEVQKVNKLFESNNVDPMRIFNELNMLLANLCSFVTTRSENLDPLISPLDPYLIAIPKSYYSFDEFLKENALGEAENLIRQNCRNFIIKLIEQLRQRLPKNIETLKKIDFFSVENALRDIKPKVFVHLEQEKCKYNHNQITMIELQWERLTLYQWKDLDSTIDFWIEVKMFRNAIGENPFEELSKFVFSFLILPISNAEVERIFSTMNLVKTKQRNRININMLNSILQVRYGLKREGKCCHDFDIDPDILKRLETCDLYSDPCDEEDFDVYDIC